MDKYYFKGKLIGSSPQLPAETFDRFAEYQHDKVPIECIVVIEMPNEQPTDSVLLNLIVQTSLGQDIYKRQCKLKILHTH